jgi:hypothetical protein
MTRIVGSSFFVVMFLTSASHAGQLMLMFDVPKAIPKSRPGGWGAIVLNFDRPITGGSFVFQPECPDPIAGNLDPANNTVIQLGPGGYRLGETGETLTSPPLADTNPHLGKKYGKLEVKIDYAGDIEPKLQGGSFWQNKLTASGQRKWNFIPSEDRRIPEPAALALVILGAGVLATGRQR